MSAPLRALVVIAAITLAGTALSLRAEPGSQTSSSAPPSPSSPSPSTSPSTSPSPSESAGSATSSAGALPLRGITIALDPGHQLGNGAHPAQIGRLVRAGGFRKPCNTTGTSTDSGVAESTVNWRVAQAVRTQLEALGARVPMTRTTDSEALWGPCVNTRGRFGERAGARLMVSLHADGAGSSDHGFHVISPEQRTPWTTDIAGPSRRLASSLRDGLTASGIAPSNYTGGGTGLVVRPDLGTLNLSDVPVAMIEMGNMRNAEDARRLTTTDGQASYAAAIVQGIRTYLGL